MSESIPDKNIWPTLTSHNIVLRHLLQVLTLDQKSALDLALAEHCQMLNSIPRLPENKPEEKDETLRDLAEFRGLLKS